LLELERLHNQVADIGAIRDDVGHDIAHAHTRRIREQLSRPDQATTGHRLLRGAVTPGDTSLRPRGAPGVVAAPTAAFVLHGCGSLRAGRETVADAAIRLVSADDASITVFGVRHALSLDAVVGKPASRPLTAGPAA
jgi:hypothetical protein